MEHIGKKAGFTNSLKMSPGSSCRRRSNQDVVEIEMRSSDYHTIALIVADADMVHYQFFREER
jgi:hypothetical protein